MKKKVAIVPFENQTLFIGQNIEQNLQKALVETIKKGTPDLLLIKPGDEGYPDALFEIPKHEWGQIDNFALAKIGRQLGLNAIITGALINISGEKKNGGILWFNDTCKIIRLQTVIEIYDTETAAKLLDESFVHEFKVDESDFKLIQTKKNVQSILELQVALKYLADIIGEKICGVVSQPSCKGYIVSIINEKIVISSGKNIGLRSGDILEVHNCNKIIEGVNGERFFVPGIKTAEIKITAVYPDKAEAVTVSGGEIHEESSVWLKN
ncbi:MAG: hypothetical protein JW786_04655 [Desulfobacterales bacterium]|nr:hypothetical protein [Desulfobacterales bacterium]